MEATIDVEFSEAFKADMEYLKSLIERAEKVVAELTVLLDEVRDE